MINIRTWLNLFENLVTRSVSFLDSFIVIGSGSSALSALDVMIAAAIMGMLISMYIARGHE